MEAIIAAATGVLGFITWNVNSHQNALNRRFKEVEDRCDDLDHKLYELGDKYALKSEVSQSMEIIRQQLVRLEDKLDQMLVKKNGG